LLLPRPDVLQLPGYTPGRSIRTVQQETGRTDVVKLASNESLWGPSPKVLAALNKIGERILYYPEVKPRVLLDRIGEAHQIDPNLLIVGNGADELLRLVAAAFVNPGDEVIYPRPSFAAYGHATRLSGGEGVTVPLTTTGTVDLAAVLAAITPKTRLIYLCNPNNPTGGAFNQAEWNTFVKQIPNDIVVVVDEAYREYCNMLDYPDVESLIQSGRSFVMVRTFSKIYGLAALRIGWAMAPAAIIDWLYRVREPFSVNLAAETAALAALDDYAWMTDVQQATFKIREFTVEQVQRLGFEVWPSQANFITLKLPSDSAAWAKALENRGYIVRATDSFGLPRNIRVTMAPNSVMQHFLDTLKTLVHDRF
jgi:histidinol-phosphate aminotransferase